MKLDGNLVIADAALALAPDSALATSARLLICSVRDIKSRWTDPQAGRQAGRQAGFQSGRQAYTQGAGYSRATIYTGSELFRLRDTNKGLPYLVVVISCEPFQALKVMTEVFTEL